MTTIPIQDLNPEHTPPATASIRGIVTLSWPYSSSTRQCAVLLADPDFRLRSRKGQVRVRFQGVSAEAVAKQRLKIGDEVILRLEGAAWVQDGAMAETPGRSVDGELQFGRRAVMQILRVGTTVDLAVDAPPSPKNDVRAQDMVATPVSKRPAPMRQSLGVVEDGRAVYNSPAFTQRLRLSGSSFSGSPFNLFAGEDETEEQPRKKQRISFGLLRQARYTERSPSPDKDTSPESMMQASTSEVGRTNTHEPDAASEVEARGNDSLESPGHNALPTSSAVMDSAMDLDDNLEQVSTSDAMAPPTLPRLRLPSDKSTHQAQEAVSTENLDTGPITPKLQAVPNSSLPLPSPFPADDSNTSRFMDSGGAESRQPNRQETHLDEESPREASAGGARDTAQGPFVQEVKSSSVAKFDASPSRDKSSPESQSQPSQSMISTTAPTAVVDSDEQNYQDLDTVAESTQSRHMKTIDHRIQLPSTALEQSPALPQTPDKSRMEVFSDRNSLTRPASNSPPQSQREQVMEQTFSSLFGYNKPPGPAEAEADHTRAASPPRQFDVSFVDSWGFDGTFESRPPPPVERSLFPRASTDLQSPGAIKSSAPGLVSPPSNVGIDEAGEAPSSHASGLGVQQSPVVVQERREKEMIGSSESSLQQVTDNTADKLPGSSPPPAALFETCSPTVKSQQSPARHEGGPIDSRETAIQQSIDEKADELESTFLPAAQFVDEEHLDPPDAASAAPTPIPPLAESTHAYIQEVIELGSSSEVDADEPTDELPEQDFPKSLAEAAARRLPTTVAQSEADERSSSEGSEASFTRSTDEEDQISEGSPNAELGVDQETLPHQERLGSIGSESHESMIDGENPALTRDPGQARESQPHTENILPQQLSVAHAALDELADAAKDGVAMPSYSVPVDRVIEDFEGEDLDSAMNDEVNRQADIFDAVPIPPRSSFQLEQSAHEDMVDEVNATLAGSEDADSMVVDDHLLPHSAAEKDVEADVIELESSSPMQRSDVPSPARVTESIEEFVTLEKDIVIARTDESMEVEATTLQTSEGIGTGDPKVAMADTAETSQLDGSTASRYAAEPHEGAADHAGEADHVDARAFSPSPHELEPPLEESNFNNSTIRYPDLPMSPSMSQSQEAPMMPLPIESRTAANAMPPTPQLTQGESGLTASQVDTSVVEMTEVTENDREGTPLISERPDINTVANEAGPDEAQVESIERAEQKLHQADQLNGAHGLDEATTTKSAVTEPANVQITQPQDGTGLKTPGRKSFRSRLSHVPDVISSWFSPKRSSAASGRERVGANAQPAALKSNAEEKGLSLTAPPVTPPMKEQRSNGILTSMTYFTPLSNLNSRINMSSQDVFGGNAVDILAVVTDETKAPTRAKGGPRDHYTIFRVADTTLNAKDSVRVEVFRPWKAVLPVAEAGDVILLRSFVVKSRKHRPYLLSTDSSAWCVWRFTAAEKADQSEEKPIWARLHAEGSPGKSRVEIKGPPVEFGDEETQRAVELRDWWLADQRNVSHEVNGSDDKVDDSHEVDV